jgi:hypothetical protein
MRRFVRYSACSVAGFVLIAGIMAFGGRGPAGRVPAMVTAWFGTDGGQRSQDLEREHHGCQPVRLFTPGRDFRPWRATSAQLAAHGFPPRPRRSTALRLWKLMIARALTFDRPHPVCGSTSRSAVYSGNWAGRVVPASYRGSGAITAAQSEWRQPAVPGDPKYASYNDAPTVSLWTGVGVTNLMQAGVDSISTATPQYRFWTEDYPQNMIWEGPPIRPGQVAFVYVRNEGDNRASYFLENVTTGVYSSFSNPLPYIGDRAADFVLERPNGRYLPSFRTLNVWDNYFWRQRGAARLTSASDRWIMTSDCGSYGTVLAAASGVSGGQFSQSWSHSRPFTNSC